MAAGPGQAAYGAVSVRVAYFARAEVVGRVPASVFIPRPRVESVLVRLERLPVPAVDPGARLLRTAERRGAGRLCPAAQDAAAVPGRRRRSRRVRARGRAARRAGRGARRGRVGQAGGAVRRLLAPAKLTVSLRVRGVRPDGYHELDAEMVTLSLADELIFYEGDGATVRARPVRASSSTPSRAHGPTSCRAPWRTSWSGRWTPAAGGRRCD